MNIRQVFLFLVFSYLFVHSCANQELPDYSLDEVPVVIDIDSVKTAPLKTSHIQYIPLETSQECFIGYADKVLIRNSQIYVADFTQAMALFVFDMQGKFIFKIAKVGKGPGEYISFRDFDIQSNGEIYMFDQFGKKFLIFNTVGEYLRDLKTDYYFSKFCLIGNKMYWSRLWESGKMFANLAVHDIVNGKTEFLLKDKKFLHDLSLLNFSTYHFYYSPNSIYYSPKFSEVICTINNEGIYPAIGIKNLLKPPASVIEKWAQEDPLKHFKLMTEGKYFIENVYIYETDDYMSIGCVRGGAMRGSLLFNKHTKHTRTILASDYFATLGVTETKGSTGEYFFSVVDFDPENELHHQILESRNELASWKEEDNPVIVLFDLEI